MLPSRKRVLYTEAGVPLQVGLGGAKKQGQRDGGTPRLKKFSELDNSAQCREKPAASIRFRLVHSQLGDPVVLFKERTAPPSLSLFSRLNPSQPANDL